VDLSCSWCHCTTWCKSSLGILKNKMVIDSSILLFKMPTLGWFFFFKEKTKFKVFFFFFFFVFFNVGHSHLDSVEKLDTVVVEWKRVCPEPTGTIFDCLFFFYLESLSSSVWLPQIIPSRWNNNNNNTVATGGCTEKVTNLPQICPKNPRLLPPRCTSTTIIK
jgi:hypothetical protein